jgi:hypothetical protein
MDRYIRLALPADVADDLIQDELAVRLLATRTGPLADVVKIAVDAINTASAAVSVAVAAATFRRLAQAFVARHLGRDRHKVTLTIETAGHGHTIEVDMEDSDAVDVLFDFFVRTLDAK